MGSARPPSKPILLANIKGFWDPLCALIDHMKRLELIRGDRNFDLLVADNVADILPMLRKAASVVSEEDKEMPAAIADRLQVSDKVTASMRFPSGSRIKAA